jgi:hypothetical protein
MLVQNIQNFDIFAVELLPVVWGGMDWNKLNSFCYILPIINLLHVYGVYAFCDGSKILGFPT